MREGIATLINVCKEGEIHFYSFLLMGECVCVCGGGGEQLDGLWESSAYYEYVY